MHYLQHIYGNTLGHAYLIKYENDKQGYSSKVQIQLSDIAVILTKGELKSLLKVLKSSKYSCNCPDCSQATHLKVVKCKTEYAEVVFKINKTHIAEFEELIKGSLFELEIQHVLLSHDIKQKS